MRPPIQLETCLGSDAFALFMEIAEMVPHFNGTTGLTEVTASTGEVFLWVRLQEGVFCFLNSVGVMV